MATAVRPLPFRCEVQPERERVILRVAGELDLAKAPIIDEELTHLGDVGFERIVVDLRRVTFIDSTGLKILLTHRERVQERGATLTIVQGPRQVEQVFELTGTAPLFTFVDAGSLR
jgi:anti-sigma B factor antagonist